MAIPKLNLVNELNSSLNSTLDGVLVIHTDTKSLKRHVPFTNLSFAQEVLDHAELDVSGFDEVTLVKSANAPGGRVLIGLTGRLDGDVDDSRRFYDIAEKLVKRALKAGIKKPLLVLAQQPSDMEVYSRFVEVSLLGALSGSYVSLCAREHIESTGKKVNQLEELHVLTSSDLVTLNNTELLKQVGAIELGKILCKDLGNSNQERMTPLKFSTYVEDAFKGLDHIKVNVLKDNNVILKEFPLFHAVARASLAIERHHPCLIEIEYLSPDQSQVKENLHFVGKGVTFDTGGADLKVGGAMRGMSRDKGGASAVAGFMLTLAHLAPKHVNVRASLSMVRNSIGADAYLCDEVILSRAGKRVLIGNTDAEGRMVMTDVLTKAKEQALEDRKNGNTKPHKLFTVATLTGHAVLAVGPYCITMDNGPARKLNVSQHIFNKGSEWADPFEISTLRREDFHMVRPGSDQEDVIQANSAPSSRTTRGHQFPMAFMIVASGLEGHGLDAPEQERIAYTHLDIAGGAESDSVGNGIPIVNGNPVTCLAGAFILNQ